MTRNGNKKIQHLAMRNRGYLRLALILLVSQLFACGGPSAETTTAGGSRPSRLDEVIGRGKLVCGVSGELPGFSFVDRAGKYAGLDVDICRAIAAALFDNPDAVEFRNLNAKERFTALQTGEVDILSRNTTWSLSRDASTKMAFAPIVFYDGQGIMVRKDSGIKSLADLKGKAICAQIGTTSEQNLADQMRQRAIAYQSVVFEDVNATFAAYAGGRCAAVTADRSGLLSRQSAFPKPTDHIILNDVLSKEPLAPAVSDGDSRWFEVVQWVVFATINAEELGVSSKNVTQQATSNNPELRRFLGTEGDLGQGLGLSKDFAARAIKHVGNYGEIYNRNLGTDSQFKLGRGLNNLWNKGGLMYAPPFR